MGEGSRYVNQGLHAAERLFAEAHPRAGEYLDQAPILVMWALPWADARDGSANTFARLWVAGHCEAGVSLKTFLRTAGFPAPMRSISARALLPSHAALYRLLARIDPAVLGRTIPHTAKAQRAWLRALDAWVGKWRRKDFLTMRFDELFQWCAERFGDWVSTDLAKDLCDFHGRGAECPFNTAWGLKRAQEEMDNWHQRITLESQLRTIPVGADQPIDLGDHPDRIEVGPMVFSALRTARQLADEGVIMRHCVATYIRSVFDGQSHIVSITEGGRRLATLELGGPKRGMARWEVRQLRGPRNSLVRPTVDSAARLYSEVLRDKQADPLPSSRTG